MEDEDDVKNQTRDCILVIGSVVSSDIQKLREMSPTSKLIRIDSNQVCIDSSVYSHVPMKMFLVSLTTMLLKNQINFIRDTDKDTDKDTIEKNSKELYLENDSLTLTSIAKSLQGYLTSNTDLFVDMGYAKLLGKYIKLPTGCGYYCQRLFPHPGWSIGASLGAALAHSTRSPDNNTDSCREVFVVVDDVAFQTSAQEISTMIRQNVKLTVFVLVNCKYNNNETHPTGHHMHIHNSWDYVQILSCFDADAGSDMSCLNDRCLGIRAATVGGLDNAIRTAEMQSRLALVECIFHEND